MLDCWASLNLSQRESQTHGYTRRMPLLFDGKIRIPLYHGTNLLFYDSIKQHGLGGRDLIKELRVIELLRELIAICEDSLTAEEDWILRMQCAKFIASQDVTEGGFNFRHGSAYLAASVEKAARYAVSSEFSSEALAQFMMLWTRLQDSRVSLPPTVRAGSLPILEFASGKKAPLVFELSNVAIDDLAAEDGSHPRAMLDSVGSLATGDDSVDGHFLGAANFEAHGPISIADARTFRVLREPANDSFCSEGYSLVLFHGESSFDGSSGDVIHRISLA